MIQLSSFEGHMPIRDISHAERFRLVVEAATDHAIYMLDPDGTIQSWNPGAERLKGYSAGEVIGRSYAMFFRPEDVEQGVPQWQLSRARINGRTEEEGWRVRKDGSTFWASIVISPIYDDDGTLLGYAKITRDVTDEVQLGKLEHALKRMNEFLAMLGHELRNPVAPIRSAVDYLRLTSENLTAAQRRSCNVLDRQTAHLTHLLDDLMDAGRLTSGKLHIRPTRASFNAMLAQALEAIAPSVEARGQKLSVEESEGEIWINADEVRITQVLQNLLSNASKFTSDGGLISVRTSFKENRLRVEVADTGQGMDPATIEELFTLFSQGEQARTGLYSGLGIGLALSRFILEMHGGSITGTSEGLGKGSSFSFELPNASVAPQ